jgi:hypothetical protein
MARQTVPLGGEIVALEYISKIYFFALPTIRFVASKINDKIKR